MIQGETFQDVFLHRLCRRRTGRLFSGTFASNLWGESRLKPVNLQILAYPEPKSLILIADPAAIKVRLL